MSSLKDKLSQGNGAGKPFIHYSPVGTFEYPKLNTPDVPKNKDGTIKTTWKSTYQVTVSFDKSKENTEFFDKMRVKNHNGELVSIKDLEGKSFFSEDEEFFKISVRRLAEKGQPRFFVPTGDKKSEEIEAPNALIWSGTTGSVSFTTYSYDGGVGAGLCGVTIHDYQGPPDQKEEASTGEKSPKAIFGK